MRSLLLASLIVAAAFAPLSVLASAERCEDNKVCLAGLIEAARKSQSARPNASMSVDVWAKARGQLALLLLDQYRLTQDDKALEEAAQILRDVLTVVTHASSPKVWADIEAKLGLVLLIGGRIHDDGGKSFEEAMRHLRLAAREDIPPQKDLAGTRVLLALALTALAEKRGNDEALLQEAVDACKAEVAARAGTADIELGRAQQTMSAALRVLGSKRHDRKLLEQALTAAHAALDNFRAAGKFGDEMNVQREIRRIEEAIKALSPA